MAWMCKDDALLSLRRWTCFCWNKPSFKSITLLNRSDCLKSIWVKFWSCDEMWSFTEWKADQRPEGFIPLYTLSCTLYVDFTLGTVTVGTCNVFFFVQVFYYMMFITGMINHIFISFFAVEIFELSYNHLYSSRSTGITNRHQGAGCHLA